MQANLKKDSKSLGSQEVAKLLGITLSALIYNLHTHQGTDIPLPDNELQRIGTDAKRWGKTKFMRFLKKKRPDRYALITKTD